MRSKVISPLNVKALNKCVGTRARQSQVTAGSGLAAWGQAGGLGGMLVPAASLGTKVCPTEEVAQGSCSGKVVDIPVEVPDDERGNIGQLPKHVPKLSK